MRIKASSMRPITPFIILCAAAPFLNGNTVASTAPNSASAIPAVAEKSPFTPDGWTDDYEAARKQAIKENKLLLVDFSGSDWCGWCVRLDEEVFSKKEFKDAVKEKFVLVFIDSPRDKKRLSPTAKKQNPQLTEKYGIHGFPSVLVLTPDGEIVAQTGYKQGGPANYVKHIDKLIEDGKAMVELRRALKTMPAGIERAKKINEVTSKLSFQEMRKNEDLVMEVLAADPDGKLGLRINYPYYTQVRPLEERLTKVMDDLNSRILKGLSPAEQRDQKIVEVKASIILTEHLPELKSLLKEAKNLSKDSNADCKPILERMIHNISGYLRFIERQKQKASSQESPTLNGKVKIAPAEK